MIKLKKLHIAHWGPVEKMEIEFNSLTVIFGENEKGKTSITEAILSCLPQAWQAEAIRKGREFSGSAALSIDLKGKTISLKKGMPPRSMPPGLRQMEPWIARLFVARAGNLAITEKDKGIYEYLCSLAMPRELSNWDVLSGAKDTKISSGRLIGPNRGAFKTISMLKTELNRIKEALALFNKVSLARLYALEHKKDALEKELIYLRERKKSYARYLLDKINALQEKLEDFPDEKINELIAIESQLFSVRRRIQKNQEAVDQIKCPREKEEKIKNLVAAWDSIQSKPQRPAIFISIALLCLSAWPLFAAHSTIMKFAALILAFGAVAFAFTAGARQSTQKKEQHIIRQLSSLAGEEIITIEQAKSLLELEAEKRIRTQQIEEGLAILLAEEEKLRRQTMALGANSNKISEYIYEIKKRKAMIQNQLNNLRREFYKLNIEEQNLLGVEPLEDGFSLEKESGLEKELAKIQEEYEEQKTGLSAILSSISQLSGVEKSQRLKDMLIRIQDLKQNLESEIKEKAAELAAKVMWDKVKSEIQEEAESIAQNIMGSNLFRENFNAFTADIYKDWDFILEEGKLILTDGLRQYDFQLLSSGAKQQLLLALRASIIEHSIGKAFLILDDTLQFTDYKRRPSAVNTLCELSKNGWQIIYMTMDNHLLSLFEQHRGKNSNIIRL